MKFSVLMSVYKNESPEFFQKALDSVLNQTLQPDEIVLVRDGMVPDELQKVIDEYVSQFDIKYIPLEKNQGLGKALAYGLQFVSNNLVARMDTDDICVSNRFEIQMRYMEEHPDISVLGGQIMEFIDTPENQRGIRKVPCTHEEIIRYMKKRNPFNHMTVFFHRDAVMEAGNYQDLRYLEDYYLWCRMAKEGCRFANVPDIVLYARTGKEMYKRRGGYEYFQSYKVMERYKLESGLTTYFQYVTYLTMRFIVHFCFPPALRKFCWEKILRKN